MCGLSTATEIWSERAATSLMRATVSALVSGPSSEAKTVSLTGPISFSNSRLTACSSCAVRNPMAPVYPAARNRATARVARRAQMRGGEGGGTPRRSSHSALASWLRLSAELPRTLSGCRRPRRTPADGPLSAPWRLAPHDLEHFSIPGGIDAGVDERGAGGRQRGREGGGEAGLVRDCPRGHAEGAGQGGRVGS